MRVMRSLLPEFIEHTRSLGGFPTAIAVSMWCDETRISFCRPGNYYGMTNGRPTSADFVFRFVQFLIAPRHKDLPAYSALKTFLARNGVSIDAVRRPLDIVEKISTLDATHGGLSEGNNLFFKFFGKALDPVKHLQLINSDTELSQVTRWLYIEAGRMSAGKSLSQDDAVLAAQKLMGCSFENYLAKVRSWHARNRFTVVLAKTPRGVPCGVSIVLPVTDEFYERVRNEECRPYECTADEILDRSGNILVESVAQEPTASEQRKNIGVSLGAAMFGQQAHLSNTADLIQGVPLRFLTFAATAEKAKFARKFGFKPIGKYMPDLGYEYIERCPAMDIDNFKDAAILGMWRALQNRMSKVYGGI